MQLWAKKRRAPRRPSVLTIYMHPGSRMLAFAGGCISNIPLGPKEGALGPIGVIHSRTQVAHIRNSCTFRSHEE